MTQKQYTPLAIANYFLDEFGSNGIEHMKLQKLAYCAYGWWLAARGLDDTPLTTEGPEIWKHGPVFDSLYHTLKLFGRRPITGTQSSNPFADPETVADKDERTRKFLTWIWERYGHLSGLELSDLTHKPGSPWHRVAKEHGFRVNLNTKIPDQYILEEFRKLLNAAEIATKNQTAQHDDRRQPSPA